MLERQKVFDDAVVDDDDFACAVAVRMGILFSRPSVCRPSRMADAVSAIERLQANGFFEIAQLAFGAANCQRPLLIDDGDARRVVATIFQLAQSIENHPDDLLVTNITDDSTHLSFLFLIRLFYDQA